MKVVPEGLHLRVGQEAPDVFNNVVSDGYFTTMHIPLVGGRPFLKTDKTNTPAVAIINEQFAHHYQPHESALGKHIHLRSADGPLVQIIGITKNTKNLWISEPPNDFPYLPFTQNLQSEMTMVMESANADAAGLTPVIRQVLQSIDRQVPAYNMRTYADLYRSRAVEVPNVILTTVQPVALPDSRPSLTADDFIGSIPSSAARLANRSDVGTAGRVGIARYGAANEVEVTGFKRPVPKYCK